MNNINSGANSGSSSIECSFCGKNGHTESFCYRKHGFANQNNNNKRVCTHCRKNGHTIDICYKMHGYPSGHKMHYKKFSQINHINKEEDVTEEGQKVVETKDIQITPQQYQILVDLFKQNVSLSKQAQINQVGSFSIATINHASDHSSIENGKFPSKKYMWILDFGATDHVYTSLSEFSAYFALNLSS